MNAGSFRFYREKVFTTEHAEFAEGNLIRTWRSWRPLREIVKRDKGEVGCRGEGSASYSFTDIARLDLPLKLAFLSSHPAFSTD